MADERNALRSALVERDRTRARRDEAEAALRRADAVLSEAAADLDHHKATLDKSERSRASELAAAIRRGHRATPSLNSAITEARAAIGEATSRHEVAQGAHDTLKRELEDAQAALARSEAAANDAALAVVMFEAEALAAEVEPTFKKLSDLDAALHGLARMWLPGATTPAKLSTPIRLAVERLRGLRELIDAARPQRIISAPPLDHVAAGRYKSYHAALLADPLVQFADVPEPKPPMPSIPRHDAADAA
jgi:hypothetical protein